ERAGRLEGGDVGGAGGAAVAGRHHVHAARGAEVHDLRELPWSTTCIGGGAATPTAVKVCTAAGTRQSASGMPPKLVRRAAIASVSDAWNFVCHPAAYGCENSVGLSTAASVWPSRPMYVPRGWRPPMGVQMRSMKSSHTGEIGTSK